MIYAIKLSLLKRNCSIHYNFRLLIEKTIQVKITTELKREREHDKYYFFKITLSILILRMKISYFYGQKRRKIFYTKKLININERKISMVVCTGLELARVPRVPGTHSFR